MLNYAVKSPVLLLAFNRPDTALQVFNKVREARPSRLYIAADGPRPGVEKDILLCAETRRIYDQIDWECTVHKLFHTDNKSCDVAVAEAITWFFQHEEEGIILEDDCLPADDFFYFCDTMLERYRYDTRMVNVTGTNLQMGKKWGDASYYFSRYTQIWGWAGWRRAWAAYNTDMSMYEEAEVRRRLNYIFRDQMLIQAWMETLQDLNTGKINSWDYRFSLINFFRSGLCITPNVNLISNIGFRADATHTHNSMLNHHANLPTGELDKPLVHPLYVSPEDDADYFFQWKDFGLVHRWARYRKEKKLKTRIKRWVKGLFK